MQESEEWWPEIWASWQADQGDTGGWGGRGLCWASQLCLGAYICHTHAPAIIESLGVKATATSTPRDERPFQLRVSLMQTQLVAFTPAFEAKDGGEGKLRLPQRYGHVQPGSSGVMAFCRPEARIQKRGR